MQTRKIIALVVLAHVALITMAFKFSGTRQLSYPLVFIGTGNPNTNELATNGPVGSMFLGQSPSTLWVRSASSNYVQLYPQTVTSNANFYSTSTNSTPLRIYCTGSRLQNAFEVYSNGTLTAHIDSAGDVFGQDGAFNNMQASGGAVIGGELECDTLLVDIGARVDAPISAPLQIIDGGSATLMATNLITITTTNADYRSQIIVVRDDTTVAGIEVANEVDGVGFDILSETNSSQAVQWFIINHL